MERSGGLHYEMSVGRGTSGRGNLDKGNCEAHNTIGSQRGSVLAYVVLYAVLIECHCYDMWLCCHSEK